MATCPSNETTGNLREKEALACHTSENFGDLDGYALAAQRRQFVGGYGEFAAQHRFVVLPEQRRRARHVELRSVREAQRQARIGLRSRDRMRPRLVEPARRMLRVVRDER